MVKYKVELKLNLGNYQSVNFGVEDCDSFNDCLEIIKEYIDGYTELKIDDYAMKVFKDQYGD